MKTKYTTGIDVAYIDRFARVRIVETRYKRAGKTAWKAVSRKDKTVSAQFYYNCVDAIPFFKNLGGTERIIKAYTPFGCLPVRLTSVSPDREQKTTREFEFIMK